MLKKAAFFDRDGTLIHDVGYLSCLDHISLLPAGLAAALRCQQQGYELFVVSNQSGIARGFFDIAFVQKTHITLDAMLQSHGIFIKEWYFCPHHPSEGINKEFIKDCSCRKPKPGMLLQAAQEHDLDLSRSLLFGDQESDLCAGRAAGCTVYNIAQYANKGR
jgi:D-glycero-D-manno-heptose 1,7-bisphosphate phosphatase